MDGICRALAKAERELDIEHWVYISLEYRAQDGQTVRLYHYDLPREISHRYQWVIRWRTARLQCLYPRESIQTYYSYYDKRTGLRTDYNSCLSKLAAAKAQITIAKKKETEYIARQKELYPMFYNSDNDPELEKFREKLKRKEQNYEALCKQIQNAVEQHRKNNNYN